MTKEEFIAKAKELNIELSDLQMQQFDTYYKELNEWNKIMNLTAITKEEDVYEKHFYDCLLSSKDIEYKGSLADIGSGAGFPGLVLKIAYEDLDVTLIEPIAKRCRFLNHIIEKLDLKKIKVINGRSEDVIKEYRDKFDLVTARAVSNLNILSELCLPYVKPNGYFVVLKGSGGHDEIENAKEAIKLLKGKVVKVSDYKLSDDASRVIALILKTGKGPLKYPREYKDIKRKPL